MHSWKRRGLRGIYPLEEGIGHTLARNVRQDSVVIVMLPTNHTMTTRSHILFGTVSIPDKSTSVKSHIISNVVLPPEVISDRVGGTILQEGVTFRQYSLQRWLGRNVQLKV
jgi:hypothetical protein